MGFPGAYFSIFASRLLINIAIALSYTKNSICVFLSWLGLIGFIRSSWQDLSERPCALSSVSACVISERLPVIKFRSFAERSCEMEDDSLCAVCLNSFEEDDEIRELCNCCHIFHRNCLDKWIDHKQKTCPLCRSPLLPQSERINDDDEGDNYETWVVDRVSHLFGEDLIVLS